MSAWKGLKQRQLNIDAPIALSLIMTFSRALSETFSGTGGGFLDSMSSIVHGHEVHIGSAPFTGTVEGP